MFDYVIYLYSYVNIQVYNWVFVYGHSYELGIKLTGNYHVKGSKNIYLVRVSKRQTSMNRAIRSVVFSFQRDNADICMRIDKTS